MLDGCFSRSKYRIQRNVRLHGCLLRAAVSALSEITAEERRKLTAKLTEILFHCEQEKKRVAALQEAELGLLHKSANICGINKKSSDVPLPAQSSSSLCVF